MDEDKARELYIKVEVAQRHLRKLHEHIEEVDGKLAEVRRMIQAVQDAAEIEEGTNMLVPLTNGVFIPVKAAKPDNYTINVGSDVTISRPPKEIMNILQKQEQELMTYQESLQEQEKLMNKQLESIQKQVKEAMNNV